MGSCCRDQKLNGFELLLYVKPNQNRRALLEMSYARIHSDSSLYIFSCFPQRVFTFHDGDVHGSPSGPGHAGQTRAVSD